VSPTLPSQDNPYQTPVSNPLPPDPEHWRVLRRQLRATVLAEQRGAMGWGGLAIILLFTVFSHLPDLEIPLHQQPRAWGAAAAAVFMLLCSGRCALHLAAAALARRRVRELEREHPESAPDFFSPP
jgi:hypothetical protein